jgi:hypothetical protein
MLEIDEVAIEELLIRHGLLAPGTDPSREELAAALSRQVELLGC